LKKGEYPAILGKLIKPLPKKGDKSERDKYRGISLVSIGSKFLSTMVLFRLRYDADKV